MTPKWLWFAGLNIPIITISEPACLRVKQQRLESVAGSKLPSPGEISGADIPLRSERQTFC